MAAFPTLWISRRATAGAPKYQRNIVEGADASEPMLNLRVPLNIVRAGIKLGAMLPEPTREKMSEKLRARGIFVDPFELASDMETFIETLSGLEIEASFPLRTS